MRRITEQFYALGISGASLPSFGQAMDIFHNSDQVASQSWLRDYGFHSVINVLPASFLPDSGSTALVDCAGITSDT